MLIDRQYLDLIVDKKSIHKWEDDTPIGFINDLINMWSRKFVLGTSPIQISKIDAYPNSALFLSYMDNIRYPLCQWYGINKTWFQKFLNLIFYFSTMELMQFLSYRSHHGISLNFVYNDGWINPRNLFIRLRKNISNSLNRALYCLVSSVEQF